MKIITHSSNKPHIENIVAKLDEGGIRPVRIDGFDIIFSNMIPAEIPSKTRFKSCDSKFCEYNTVSPSDWEIFCGYVKPEMELHFVLTNDRQYTVCRGT